MKLVREYDQYEDYVDFQKKKTSDPIKRKKWLEDEWDSKVDGFKNEFSKLSNFLTADKKCLCLGARTGQEVAALVEMGVTDSVGIDLIAQDPHVVEGDIHQLDFEDNTFDFIYTNIIDHSVDPRKMIAEAERVLKINGVMYVQCQLGVSTDRYTEYFISNPFVDIIALFDQSYCIHCSFIKPDRGGNFCGMNFDVVLQKDEKLAELFNKWGTVQTVKVPENYVKIWEDINLEIQSHKLDSAGIDVAEDRHDILTGLMRRAYYLTRVADVYECKNIAEVGTAQGWQFYSFCEYADSVGGTVISCDPRDVRHTSYREKFEDEKNIGKFINATSLEMSMHAPDIDMFYIDGLHDKGTVITDINNLIKCQNSAPAPLPVWVLDDFDSRFGCCHDIAEVCQMSQRFKVYYVGKTASGFDSHQAIVIGRIS